MLSRRNVRIKIMQLLFSLNRDQSLHGDDILKAYEKFINQSFSLYLFNLFLLQDVCQYASLDEEKRKGKYLPTPEDLLFRARMYDNPCMKNLRENVVLQKIIKAHGFSDAWDTDISKKVYFEFAKSPEYLDYVFNEGAGTEDHIAMLLACYKFIIKHEMCEELIDDRFPNWYDDKSLIIGAMKKTIKALPNDNPSFYDEYKPDHDTCIDFGKGLLDDLVRRDEELVEYIEPLLKNWDKERVAVIDFILLKMAAAEYLRFENIPGNVTINEYVEIAKMYSTEKSKEFINGVVDKLFEIFAERGLKKSKD
jgi:transcription antitermination protein NusB